MPAPLPPLLDGPITTVNKQVYVDNLLPNATVTVYSNGVQVGKATTVNPGAILVPVSALHHGHEITAKQTYNGSNPNISATGASDPSNAIKVQDAPNPLPAPVFASGLITCSETIYMSNLIPGAKLHVTENGNTLIHGVYVTQVNQAFPLAGTLVAGDSLQAWQSAGSNVSPTVGSLPVGDQMGALPAPVVAGPLLACQTAINLSNLIPSANIEVVNGGTETFVSTPWSEFELDSMTPLVAGTLTARQYFTKCDRAPSSTATFTVTSSRQPFPVVSYKPCGDIRQLFISKLIPGSVLTIKRVVAETSNTNTITNIGSMGISQPTATVNLPTSFSATDPNGPVSLWIEVLLCSQNLDSPGYTKVTFAANTGPYGKPVVETPLYACASVVVVSGLHPGSQIQIFSGSTSTARSNPVIATGPKLVVPLWTPMVEGESIFARQLGCNSSGESKHEPVQSIGKLTQPVITTPVRPGDTGVQVTGVLPGALVTLLVNGIARSQTTALASSAWLSAGIPALGNGDTLEAVQALCTQVSAPGAAKTALGEIKVSGVPGSMIQNKAVQLLIGATDSVTGAVLENLPVTVARDFDPMLNPIGPSSSGFTGSSFDYTPGKTDTTAKVFVTDNPGYIPTLVSTVVTPPPAPPPPAPTVSFSGGKVYGKHFPCTECVVTGVGDAWGFVSQGPWRGDIVTGISIQTPCAPGGGFGGGGGGESFQIQVACVSDPSVSVTQTIKC